MTQIMSVGKFGIKNLCIILQATMAAFGCKYGSSMSPITLGLRQQEIVMLSSCLILFSDLGQKKNGQTKQMVKSHVFLTNSGNMTFWCKCSLKYITRFQYILVQLNLFTLCWTSTPNFIVFKHMS